MTLPELRLADWRATKDTLHLYCQVVGKIRLALAPPRNHWWQVPLYVDVRGLTTRRMHDAGTTFQIDLDFVEHRVHVRTMDGRDESFALEDGLAVADFQAALFGALERLGLSVEIRPEPFGVPMTTPFAEDREHASWDRQAVERFWHTLDWSDRVLETFSGWFTGKASPVHLFWHSFDLATARFSGRPAPAGASDPVSREAYSAEVIAFGFWAGDDTIPEAAFYSYTAPEPPGLTARPLRSGRWVESGTGSLALLPYADVRAAADPAATLLGFLQSAYEAGAGAAGWDVDAFRSSWAPS